MAAFDIDVVVPKSRHSRNPELGLLGHLEALTFDFERDGHHASCVLIYAEPDPDQDGVYRFREAAETGFEGIACVDDTARAALLALQVYEHTGSRKALSLARRWLSFVQYMQYPDGEFANFIRNASGVRNATGPTSLKGGLWWSARAKWALARAYRVTGDVRFRDRFEACRLDPGADGKLNGALALAALELYAAEPTADLRQTILHHGDVILGDGNRPYFVDHPDKDQVHMWGYHQLHAVASMALALDEPRLLASCRHTVQQLIEPAVRDRFWHSFPDKSKVGVCAYDISPTIQGLAAMYRATGAAKYRTLALQSCAWFYGRNDARTAMYDPTTGRCRDGISQGKASRNYGAESAIEAGVAELERRTLLQGHGS